MRVSNPTVTEPGFIALCIQLAQATFSEVMPGKQGTGTQTAYSAKPVPRDTDRTWLVAINDWFYRQQVKEREAYLAQSTDIFDLERRIRDLDRRPYY